jgi:hypothetical protein
VYVECWKNGFTEFPSPTMKRLIGTELLVNGKDAPQRNLLGEALIEAHRNGLLCIAWFEYGFMAAWKDSEHAFRAFARERGWLTVDRHGSEVGKVNSFVWLNPFHPDVQQFLIDISLDAVRSHDLDGIQLDDRIALPVDMGYDEYTRGLFKRETGRDLPDDPRDAGWMKWRADKISAFALRYVTELRAANPGLIISVSPAPYPWSYDNYLCDWMNWTKWCYCGGKRWDEYVPQCYRMSGEATVRSIDEQVDQIGEPRDSLVTGIRVVGDGPDMPWEGLRQAIDHGRARGVGGHCLWFSRGVLDLYEGQLTQLYDVKTQGHARHPLKTSDWRTGPIVATQEEGGSWTATVEEGNRYRLIVKREGRWSEMIAMSLDPGEHRFVEPDAEGVELLVDRRP